MTPDTPNLGHLIRSGSAHRDAVHIAVAPVIAAERLAPGTHIGFVGGDTKTVGVVEKPIGIVDPFLTEPVEPGGQFWLFLYPNTVTSLRHVWTHPAFTFTPPPRSRDGQ